MTIKFNWRDPAVELPTEGEDVQVIDDENNLHVACYDYECQCWHDGEYRVDGVVGWTHFNDVIVAIE